MGLVGSIPTPPATKTKGIRYEHEGILGLFSAGFVCRVAAYGDGG